MNVISTAVKHLMQAGVTGDALLRAIEEIEAALSGNKPRTAGAIRQERYREKAREEASQSVTVTESDASPLSLPPNENNSNPPTHTREIKTRARKGTRLSADWKPSELTGDTAAAVSSWPVGSIDRELSRFRDWAASATGTNAVKSDWDAAWRNWLRKAQDEGRYAPAKPKSNGFNHAPQSDFEAFMSGKAR